MEYRDESGNLVVIGSSVLKVGNLEFACSKAGGMTVITPGECLRVMGEDVFYRFNVWHSGKTWMPEGYYARDVKNFLER